MKKYIIYIGVLTYIPLMLSVQETFLIFGGKTGWIGKQLVTLLQEKGEKVFIAESRLEKRNEVENEIDFCKPTLVINAAGITGTPNIDWCEDHQQETIRTNIIGTLNLVDICQQRGIHITNLATGCIYSYDEEHQVASGKGFKETDEPNFKGSFYSETKVMIDRLMNCYPQVLTLRIRMPIADDLHPRNFITKISRYEKVVNIPNSMTVLHDLLPVIIEMTMRRIKGTFNFVNPGTISHNEILDLYTSYIDPTYTYVNFTEEEQNRILKARRSNNELDVSKLLSLFPNIPPISESIHGVFKRMQKNLKRSSYEDLFRFKNRK